MDLAVTLLTGVLNYKNAACINKTIWMLVDNKMANFIKNFLNKNKSVFKYVLDFSYATYHELLKPDGFPGVFSFLSPEGGSN